MKTAREYTDEFYDDACHAKACEFDTLILESIIAAAMAEARAGAIMECKTMLQRVADANMEDDCDVGEAFEDAASRCSALLSTPDAGVTK